MVFSFKGPAYLVFCLAGNYEVAEGRVRLRRTTENQRGVIRRDVFFEERASTAPDHRLARADWYAATCVFSSRAAADAEALQWATADWEEDLGSAE